MPRARVPQREPAGKKDSDACVAASVRWATKKVPLLLENFQMIVDAGGDAKIKKSRTKRG